LAPEVYRERDGSAKGYGSKIDLFAAGCVLYKMLTGFEPFERDVFTKTTR
jgi:serine/threonine protein kinase